jgi:hypothetical protein
MLMMQLKRNIAKTLGVDVEMKVLHRLLELDSLSAHVYELRANLKTHKSAGTVSKSDVQ